MDLLNDVVRVNIDFNQAINYIVNNKKEKGIKNLSKVVDHINKIIYNHLK